MIASDRILKMITLIRMFGVPPSAPTAEDNLSTYSVVLCRQLCALVIKHGARATHNALALTDLSIKLLGPTTAAEPISPNLLRLLRFSKSEESRDQSVSN